MAVQSITFGGGCFWCTEAVFVRVKGVMDVESGYCNGHTPHPSYEQVCSGQTGHVEVVRLVFDPEVVGLDELLQVFFAVHDPSTLNRQGNDVGTQYRSGIYASDEGQLTEVKAWVAAHLADGSLPRTLVTELELLQNYSPAEAYHQDYFEQHPGQGYCAMVVGPKVEKFRKTFARLLSE